MRTLSLNSKTRKGVDTILFNCGQLKRGETCCVVSDKKTAHLGDALVEASNAEGVTAKHFVIEPFSIHGQEPPSEVAREMRESDLVIGLTKYSMAHTSARYEACRNGARYLSLPDYSEKVLGHPSLQVDYERVGEGGRKLVAKLSRGKRVHIQTKAGTDIRLNYEGRPWNFCPGYVNTEKLILGSPPDIEINVAPLEDQSEGIVVVDGSIPVPGLGKLDSSVTLLVQKGKIVEFKAKRRYKQSLEKLFRPHAKKARVLAEFGIGLNPKAKLCGILLIDEGCLGTFHFGFGSNATIGGKNAVKFHVDFVFYASSFWLDGRLMKVS